MSRLVLSNARGKWGIPHTIRSAEALQIAVVPERQNEAAIGTD